MSNKFPLKLMSILDSNEHNEIISWLPHGRGFIIRDKRRLADEVLPKYFKESKYTSFTRRLNRWNFTIQTHGHKEASYFHPMFIRGDPQRSLEMHPTPQASNKARESRYIDAHVNDSKRSNANVSLAMSMSNPSAGYSGGMINNVGVAGSSMPLPSLEGGSSGLRGAAVSGQYVTMDDAMARTDVSAQVMAAGGAAAAAGNANDPYLDQYRAQAGVQHPHHALAHAQQNVTVMSAPLQTLQLANAPIQPQFYGQAVAVNPMFASHHQPHNAPHAQPNYSREIIYSRMPMERDVNVSTGMPREQYHTHNGMVIIQHPQLGTATPVVHPQMQQQFGDYSHYIPTTPASHAHLQARYGHASTPGHTDPNARTQAQMQQARAMQHQVQYINPPSTPVNAAPGSAPLGIHQYSAMNYPPQGQGPPAAALKSQEARNQNAGANIGASFDAAATKQDSTGKESGTEKDAKEDGAKDDKPSDEKGGDAKAKEEAIATATASEEKEKLATEQKEKKENESASAPNSEKEKKDDEAKKPMEPKEDPKEAASESEADKSQSEKAADAPSSATTKRSADAEPSSQPPEKKAKSPSPPPAEKTEKNASSESAKKEDEDASVDKKNGELTI